MEDQTGIISQITVGPSGVNVVKYNLPLHRHLKNLVKKTWVAGTAIIAFIMGLFGGIPGIRDYFQNQPILHVKINPIIPLPWSANPKDINPPTCVVFGITIANEGKRPLHIDGYALRIKIGNKWEQFKVHYLPHNFWVFPDGGKMYVTEKPEDDLSRHPKAVTQDAPLSGSLFFTSEPSQNIALDFPLKIEDIEITFLDVYDRCYTYHPYISQISNADGAITTWASQHIRFEPPPPKIDSVQPSSSTSTQVTPVLSGTHAQPSLQPSSLEPINTK
jgi:hypothetical protein